MSEVLDTGQTTSPTPTEPQKASLETIIKPTTEEAGARLEKYSSLHPALAEMVVRAKEQGLVEVVDSIQSRIAFLIKDEQARTTLKTESTNSADKLLMSNKALYYSVGSSLEQITQVPSKRDIMVTSLEQQREFHPQMLFISDTMHTTPDQLHEVLGVLTKTLGIKETASLQSSRQATEDEATSAVDYYPGGNELYKVGSTIVQEAHFDVPGRGVMVFKIIRVNLEPDYDYVAEGTRAPNPQTITAMMVFEPTKHQI
jgi:hypothetical protein